MEESEGNEGNEGNEKWPENKGIDIKWSEKDVNISDQSQRIVDGGTQGTQTVSTSKATQLTHTNGHYKAAIHKSQY